MSVNTTAQARKWERTLHNIKYFTFWTLSILIVGGFSYFYYSYLMRPVAGALFFLGGAIIVYYYYIKWFKLPPPIDPDFKPGEQACPDYLTLIPPGELYPTERDGSYFCVDFVGVSQNGRLMRTTPKNLVRDIQKPSHRFKVTPSVELSPYKNKQRAHAAFMQRLKNAGLSWNSLSGSSIPSRVVNSNGAPVYTGGSGIDFTVDFKGLGNSLLAGAGCLTSNDDAPATPPSWTTAAGAGGSGPAPGALMSASASAAAPAGGAFTLTPAAMKELEDYGKTHPPSQSGPPTDAQLQEAVNHLIAKGMAPRGTTGAQLMTAMMGGPALNLTPAQLTAIKAALEEYGKVHPPPPTPPGGQLDFMTPLTAALNGSLIPKGLVPPGTSAIQLMQELMKQAQRDQQNAGMPSEFMIQSGPLQGRM